MRTAKGATGHKVPPNQEQASSPLVTELMNASLLRIQQRKELGELFGFETRNKYEIGDSSGQPIGFAAEQAKGLMGSIGRQFLGHWRTFDVMIFDVNRAPVLRAHHPFRWIFQRLELFDSRGKLVGSVQQRFAILSKRFAVMDSNGGVLCEVNSPLWRPWTFAFERKGRPVGCVRKKWSGLIKESIMDADNFEVEFTAGTALGLRALILAAAFLIDLVYFEKKAR